MSIITLFMNCIRLVLIGNNNVTAKLRLRLDYGLWHITISISLGTTINYILCLRAILDR